MNHGTAHANEVTMIQLLAARLFGVENQLLIGPSFERTTILYLAGFKIGADNPQIMFYGDHTSLLSDSREVGGPSAQLRLIGIFDPLGARDSGEAWHVLIIPSIRIRPTLVLPPCADGQGRRGYGVGLVTTAMFLGQFLAPIVTEPLIDPNDPGAVWKSISGVLLCLAVLYGVLAKVGGEPKPLGELAVDDGTGPRTSDVTR